MALSIVKNRINGKVKTVKLPCTGEEAKAVADTFFEGVYEVFESEAVAGSDAVALADAVKMNIMAKDDTTEDKTYFNLVVNANKKHDDIFTALKGLTLNGVKIDTVYCLGVTPLVE